MSIRDKLIGAITVMNEADVLRLWAEVKHMAGQKLTEEEAAALWSSIPEEEPDQWDLEMIAAANNDPDCKEIATDEEVKKVLGND